MTTEQWLKVLPISLSAIALVVSVVSAYTARKSYGFARSEFLSSRTLILTSSIRPALDESVFELLNSTDPVKRQEGRKQWVDGFKNGLLVFKPSLKPNTLMEVGFSLPPSVTLHHSVGIGNISAGSMTAVLVEKGMIKEGDFAVPAFLIGAKLEDWLRRITPVRYKVQYGSLNRAALPVIADIDMIAKGERLKERQLYELEVAYQVSETDEVVIQQLSLSFLQRLEYKHSPSSLLDQMMPNFGVRFLSEPLPVTSNQGPNSDDSAAPERAARPD